MKTKTKEVLTFDLEENEIAEIRKYLPGFIGSSAYSLAKALQDQYGIGIQPFTDAERGLMDGAGYSIYLYDTEVEEELNWEFPFFETKPEALYGGCMYYLEKKLGKKSENS